MANKVFKITELQLGILKDLIVSYSVLLENTKEEDEFMDGLRQSRIMDCEDAILQIQRLQGGAYDNN